MKTKIKVKLKTYYCWKQGMRVVNGCKNRKE